MPEVSNKIKLIVLGLLVLQNATQTLMMRYSRGILNESYNPTMAVIATECCKFSVCTILIAIGIGESGLAASHHSIASKVVHLVGNSGYTWVPATCYFLQNSLQYVASENLSSSVFAVLQQMKILSAALASVFILGRHLMWRQWRALLLLVAGGLLMEYHTFALHNDGTLDSTTNDPVKGTAAILTIVGLSGFAGVMTELLLKNKKVRGQSDSVALSIWDRNIQLSFWSIIFGFVSLMIDRSWMSKPGGLFHGFSGLTLFLVAIWTAGGLLVAMTIKYLDVIIKGFASAISLILICFCGSLFLGDYLDIVFLVGATVTVIATFNYNDKEKPLDFKEKWTPPNMVKSEGNSPNVAESERQPLKHSSV